MVNLEPILVGLAVVLFGLGFAGFGVASAVPQVQQTSSAVPVDAVVTSSAVETNTGPREDRTYIPVVTYRYTYEGKEYTSDSVFAGQKRSAPSDRSEEIVENHPEGAEVTAMVVPGDPEAAYLIDPGLSMKHLVLPVVGLLAVLIGLGKIVQGLRGGRGPITIGV